MILGSAPRAGVPGTLAALALMTFAFGLSWVFTTSGLLMRTPNAVMNTGFMAVFPLTFLSNVYVDPSTLPSALEAFVNVNPNDPRGRLPGPDAGGLVGERHVHQPGWRGLRRSRAAHQPSTTGPVPLRGGPAPEGLLRDHPGGIA